MSALIGLYQPAVNRLLPYRALHTDLVAHEEYYEFNDPTVLEFESWTQGSNVTWEPGTGPYFDGAQSSALYPGTTATDDTNVYVESAVSNLDTALPTTFRVIARSDDANRWLRIYDPNDADTDVWVDLNGQAIGTLGADVIEARLTIPPTGTTQNSTGNPGSSADDEANGFVQVDVELAAAASRTMRLQLVDGDGEVNFTGSTASNLFWVARAEALNGKVSKWTCRRTGRSFSQATAANQPYARPMGVPKFNGRRVLKFDGGQDLVSDDGASVWDFLHSGAPCSVYAVYMPTTASSLRLMSTSDGASEGFRIRTDIDADTRTGVDVWNASDTAIISVYSLSGTTPIEALYVAGYRAQDGHAGGDAVLDVGGAQYTGNASTWGSSGAPTTTLHIGSENGDAAFVGYIADIAIYEARLTDDEHARVVEEFEALNASSASIPGCVGAFRPDLGISGSESLTGWESYAGSGVSASPVGTIALPVAQPSLRGSPAVHLANESQRITSGSAVPVADLQDDHAVILCGQVLGNDSGDALVCEISDNALGTGTKRERLAIVSGQWSYTREIDGGSSDTFTGGAADFRPHVHSLVFEDGAWSAYIDAAPAIAAEASNPGDMSGANRVDISRGSSSNDGSIFLLADWATYNTAPTTYQRQLVERAQRRRMLGMIGLKMGFSLGQNTPAPSASLLSVAQSVGAVLLFDMYTPSAYATSGANVVSVTNLISSMVHPWGGGINPPVFNATGLNGGPCWEGNGADDRQFVGTEAAVLALLANNTPHEVFAVCSFNVADANGYIFGANAATSFIRYGQSSTGAGRWHMRSVNDSSTSIAHDTSSDHPADTNPHLFNFRRSSVASIYVDQVATNIDNTPHDATVGGTQTMTFSTYRWGHYQSAAAGEIDGKASLLVITPALDSTQRAALIAAMKAHHPALGSLIS